MVTNTHEKRTGTHLLETLLFQFRQYGDALASIPHTTKLASRPGYSPLCQNRHTLTFSLHCLQATRFVLDKCHLNASHLRQEHIQEQARLAALTSNITAKEALNNILKAEAASATFRKLKHYAKGEHRTALQRVEVPNLDSNSQPTGVNTLVINSLELYTAITNQNILHFSQVMDTPGVSGHLGHIIPPFTQYVHSTSIIQAPLAYQI